MSLDMLPDDWSCSECAGRMFQPAGGGIYFCVTCGDPVHPEDYDNTGAKTSAPLKIVLAESVKEGGVMSGTGDTKSSGGGSIQHRHRGANNSTAARPIDRERSKIVLGAMREINADDEATEHLLGLAL